jgi:hypothetical protein
MGLGPTQGDEKRVLFSNYSPWKRRSPLCHLDRSVPGFPTSRCWRRPRVRLSLKESRMETIRTTGLHRKSGGAQWRDLFVDALSWECFATDQALRRDLRFLPRHSH